VLARKSGTKWYIAGINGTAAEKSLALNLDIFKGKKATCFFNSKGDTFIDQKQIALKPGQKEMVSLAAHDGFVIIVE
jgi:hypothetical protein